MPSSRKDAIADLEHRLSPKRRPRAVVRRVLAAAGYGLSLALGFVFDRLFALLGLVLLALPVGLLLLLRRVLTGKRVFERGAYIGRGGRTIRLRLFNLGGDFPRSLPLFAEVLSGRVQLVGPALRKAEGGESRPGLSYIRAEKPGLFSLWFIRESSRTAHEGRFATDWESVFRKSLVYDLAILLKSIPALLYHQSVTVFDEELDLFGYRVANIDMDEAVGRLIRAGQAREKTPVFFVNPDCFNKTFKDPVYAEVLARSRWLYPDGIGVALAGKILKHPLRQNINGTDLFPFLCQAAAREGFRIYLLGGKPGVAEKAASNMLGLVPGLEIAGFRDGYFDREKDSAAVVAGINAARADILLVAFGAPLQETWIDRHKDELGCPVLLGVGGLFDFYSENVKRAPRWVREIGMEWVFRILQEPGRMWKRYVVGNPAFLVRVLRWKYRRA